MEKFRPKILLFIFLLVVIFSSVFGTYKTEAQALEPLTGPTNTGGLDLGNTGGLDYVPTDFVQQPVQAPANTVVQGANTPGAGAADDAAKRETPKPPINASCVGGEFPWFHLDACVALIVNMLMWIVSWFLYLAGFIFDQSMQFTLNISDLMTRIPVVDIGWKIFRDLANVFFIFILLWIAMSTILGFNSGKTKELIVHLVVVAILMNFSLFITKTIIDGSNIIALHFYNLIITSPQNGFLNQGSMSGAFMEGLRIQTIYDGSAVGDTEGQKPRQTWGQYIKNVGTSVVGGTLVGGPVGGVVAGAAALTGKVNVINWGKIILIGIFGSALMLIAAYVFLVGAVLMLIRAIVLMFVMMLSPLAFLAFAMPFAEKFVEPWRDALIKQCIFAPAFMILSYVVVKTIQSDAFKGVTTVTVGAFSSAFTAGSGGGVAMIMNFLLIIGLMLGCILVAKKLEVHGLELAKAVGSTGARWVASGRFFSTAGSVANYGLKTASSIMRMPSEGLGKSAAFLSKVPAQFAKIPGVNKIDAVKNFGQKSAALGEKISTKLQTSKLGVGMGKAAAWADSSAKKTEGFGEKLQRKFDINELNKKFRDSAFGATELGDWIRGQTTERLVHAKFGGEKSVHESYEEGEALHSRRFAIENMENAKKSADELVEVLKEKLKDAPDWKDKKYKDKDGKFDQTEYDKDFEKFAHTFQPILESYLPNRYAKEYRNPDGTFNQALFDKDTAEGKVEFNKKYKNPDGTFNQAEFNKDTDEGKLEFAEAQKMFESVLKRQPKRAAFSDENAFEKKMGSYLKLLTSPPEKRIYIGYPPGTYERARKIYDDRRARKEFTDKKVEEVEARLSQSLNQVDPKEFARMHEEIIHKMARYANLRQLKAVMESDHWTVPEKKEMLRVRWDNEIQGYKEWHEKMEAFDMERTALYKTAMEGYFAIDQSGDVVEDAAKGVRKILKEGVEYLEYKDTAGKTLEIKLPKEPPPLPSELRHWARNKMSLPEYELAASIAPDIFENPSLVQVIRWGTIFRDLRYNEALPYNVRNGMTYLKDWPLEAVVNRNSPKYIEENTEDERREACRQAKLAADTETDDTKKDAVYRKTYEQYTQNDTIREYIVNNWLQGRAVNEIPRGKYRNSHIYHRVVNKAMGQQWKDKDAEDITSEDNGLLTHAILDYQAEERGEGIVSDANRELLSFIFCDPRSNAIPQPIGHWPTERQELYRRLEAEGKAKGERGTIEMPSDKIRGIKHKTP